MAKRGIPVFAEVDVVVVGGSSGGVAAAQAAAKAGASVFLGASESYLGEEVCGTGQFWQSAGEAPSSPLAKELLAQGSPLRPMDVKRTLDDALVNAGVRFLFLCTPADLLVDGEGRAAGVVFASKSGLFAVRAKRVIDATFSARLARAAGLPFRAWSGGGIEFRRVVMGARPSSTEGLSETVLGPVQGPESSRNATVEAVEYRATLPLASWDPASVAEAEQQMRDRTWHKDMTWMADRCAFVPPVHLEAASLASLDAQGLLPPEACATAIAGLSVLGPCGAVTREAAAQLQGVAIAIAAGEALGRTTAQAARTSRKPRGVRPLRSGNPGAVREGNTCPRLERQNLGRLPVLDAASLPVLGTFDVVVGGGGTGGAPAAIAAARAGARTLCLETTHGLGGVGTLGFISSYYHGFREGFTREMTDAMAAWNGPDFNRNHWNPEHKAEWFRSEYRKAGGVLWFGTIVSGAVVEGRRVTGLVVNTPWGRGLVKAGLVIDSTGNCDIPALAGAACREVSESDLAVQGTGMPSRPFLPGYRNTDYTFVEDSDLVDTSRAFVVGRRKFAREYDMGQILDTRERRQIVGDVTVTPLDVYTGRTWRDALCLSRSNFDSHGFTVHPIFHVLPPDRTELDAWLPLRAVLPKGWSGIAVTGLGVSAQRDVMPVLRMIADIQNHAYGLGTAAAWAAAEGHRDFRRVDIRRLQRAMFAHHVTIPQVALTHAVDAPAPSSKALDGILSGTLETHAEVALAMLRPEETIRKLAPRVAEPAADAGTRLRRALLLAMLGSEAGEGVLVDALQAPWDQGWNYTGMGQFGRSLSQLDDVIVGLARLRSEAARPAVLAKAAQLDASSEFSHFRAVALYAEAVGGRDAADTLAALLRKPGIGGHAWVRLEDELANIPASHIDTTTRNASLRELYVARALFRAGDVEGLGRATLERYAGDLRGHFAQHAAVVLAAAPGRSPA